MTNQPNQPNAAPPASQTERGGQSDFLSAPGSPQELLDSQKIINEMPGGFFIYRTGGREEIIYANQALLRLFNCATLEEFREFTGNSFRGIVHPDDLERVEASIAEQISNSQYDLDYVEYRIIQKGGAIRWVEDYGHFTHTEFAGDVFYVFIADATEKQLRMQQEKDAFLLEQHQNELFLQSTIESYAKELSIINLEQARRLELIEGLSIDYESIFYVDLDANLIQPYRMSSRIEYQFGKDRKMCRFTGFADDYILQWVHPEDRKAFRSALSPEFIRASLANQTSFHVPYRIRKDSETTYLMMYIVNVSPEASGRVSQVVMGCRSVDDEIRREREHNQILETALSQAKAADAARNAFLSNMSHDIRTPMNAIIGFTSLAKSHLHEPAKLQGYLDMIESSSCQLLQLVDDVLEISRLESGYLHLEDAPFDLADLARDIRDAIVPEANTKSISVRTDLSGLTHTAVRGDRTNLFQILMRLAGNAVKYTENGGHITLTFAEQNASPEYASYQFTVEDDGIGISESFLAHVFEPFERQKNTTLSGVQGTGLGLPIARSIAEMMGGTINVSSVSGEGSRFTLSLSLRLYEPEPAAAAEPAHAAASAHLLLVEDNAVNLEIELELLGEEGFLLDTAADGSIALEKVRSAPPGTYDLILMDIQMPVMDGRTAARAIRALPDPLRANIPIIALSANSFSEDRKLSLESGINAHLPKPIDLPRLLETIQSFLTP